jgi:hypothetical protein
MVLYEQIGCSETDSPVDCLVESDALPVVLAYPGRILWAGDVADTCRELAGTESWPGQRVDPGQKSDRGRRPSCPGTTRSQGRREMRKGFYKVLGSPSTFYIR